MINKSDENLEAAKHLLKAGFPNASASRAYYSAYHACWWTLDRAGIRPDNERGGSPYWSHDGIAEQACIHGPDGFSGDLRDEYNDLLLAERIIADYDLEGSSPVVVEECIRIAEEISGIIKGNAHE